MRLRLYCAASQHEVAAGALLGGAAALAACYAFKMPKTAAISSLAFGTLATYALWPGEAIKEVMPSPMIRPSGCWSVARAVGKLALQGGIIAIGGVAAGLAGAVVAGLCVIGYEFYQAFAERKTGEELLLELLSSRIKKNRVLTFEEGGKSYQVRCVYNPAETPIHVGGLSIHCRCILAPEPDAPIEILTRLHALIQEELGEVGIFMVQREIDGRRPIDLYARA